MAFLRHRTTREIVPIYWRRLIEMDVPIEAARTIAWTIARYERARLHPSPNQQSLIRKYCRCICRAGLWRANLLST